MDQDTIEGVGREPDREPRPSSPDDAETYMPGEPGRRRRRERRRRLRRQRRRGPGIQPPRFVAPDFFATNCGSCHTLKAAGPPPPSARPRRRPPRMSPAGGAVDYQPGREVLDRLPRKRDAEQLRGLAQPRTAQPAGRPPARSVGASAKAAIADGIALLAGRASSCTRSHLTAIEPPQQDQDKPSSAPAVASTAAVTAITRAEATPTITRIRNASASFRNGLCGSGLAHSKGRERRDRRRRPATVESVPAGRPRRTSLFQHPAMEGLLLRGSTFPPSPHPLPARPQPARHRLGRGAKARIAVTSKPAARRLILKVATGTSARDRALSQMKLTRLGFPRGIPRRPPARPPFTGRCPISRPPGFKTRYDSRIARRSSGTCLRDVVDDDPISNVASSNGIAVTLICLIPASWRSKR